MKQYDPAIPDTYEGVTDKQMAAEYRRMRKTARDRLNRLEAAGFTREQIYQLNKDRFPVWSELKTKREKAAYMRDLQMFLASEKSTVAGIRRNVNQTIDSLREAGYDFISNYSELREFLDFMEYTRERTRGRSISSPVTAEKYRIWKEERKTPEEVKGAYNEWLTGQMEERGRAQELAELYRKISSGK